MSVNTWWTRLCVDRCHTYVMSTVMVGNTAHKVEISTRYHAAFVLSYDRETLKPYCCIPVFDRYY